MAVDWIKMRVDLLTHPKVVRIMSACKADKFRVIGGLHAVWSVFDAHSEDGCLDGYSAETMDSIIGWDGFSSAMMSVGWLAQNGETLVAPNFEEHNGRTAKRRAMETQRKKAERKLSALDADEMRTREEKRREDVNLTPKERESTPTPTSTASGRVCARLRKAGITGVNPSNPKLLALLGAGIPEDEFCDLALEDKAKGKGMAWILATVEGRRKDAAILAIPASAPEKPPAVCVCCGAPASKRIGRNEYCSGHDQFSERAAA